MRRIRAIRCHHDAVAWYLITPLAPPTSPVLRTKPKATDPCSDLVTRYMKASVSYDSRVAKWAAVDYVSTQVIADILLAAATGDFCLVRYGHPHHECYCRESNVAHWDSSDRA